jgi:hypothetical protein
LTKTLAATGWKISLTWRIGITQASIATKPSKGALHLVESDIQARQKIDFASNILEIA